MEIPCIISLTTLLYDYNDLIGLICFQSPGSLTGYTPGPQPVFPPPPVQPQPQPQRLQWVESLIDYHLLYYNQRMLWEQSVLCVGITLSMPKSKTTCGHVLVAFLMRSWHGQFLYRNCTIFLHFPRFTDLEQVVWLLHDCDCINNLD